MNKDELRRRLRERLEHLIDDAVADGTPRGTIDEVEALAVSLGNRAKQEIACELVEAASETAGPKDEDQVRASKWQCSCGRSAWYSGESDHYVASMAGTLRIARSYYYCRRCDRGFCPADKQLGVTGTSFTLAVQQTVVELDASMKFTAGVDLLNRLTGVSVSAKQAQRMLGDSAPILEEYLDELKAQALAGESIPEIEPDVLYVMADGVHTPMVGGWRETKIGLARAIDATGAQLGKTLYASHLGDSQTFGEYWYSVAHQLGVLKARLVVAVGDGAAWIWNQVEHHFPGALQIVDYWHAVEHVWEVARAVHGVDSPQAKAFVASREQDLWSSDWKAFYAGFTSLRVERSDQRELVEKTIGYFQNNQSRMDYPRYREMGLSIGSGAVESACKQVISQRLKGAGMRWKQASAQSVGRIRCLVMGGQWETFRESWRKAHAAASLSPVF